MTNAGWDLCVLGAGPAGYAAAMRAHDLGKRVLLVEKDKVGGAGIHAGALSSKTLWHLSNDYAVARLADRGYHAPGGIEVEYGAVMEGVQRAVSERQQILDHQLDGLAKAAGSGAVISLVRGAAKFKDPTTIEIAKVDGTTETISAANYLIATGSNPRIPKEYAVDGETIVTSDHIEQWTEFPSSMVIVGAGVIGCEYAAMFANFGKTKSYIIDRQPRILPFEDEDVAEEVARSFERLGITIHSGSKLESLKVVDKQVEYVITNAEGKTETIRVDKALVSIGRVPNTSGLGLEAAGVELDKGGGIVVKACQSTTAPHIWAAGDVTMDIALVNVAELEGRYAVERMFDLEPRPIRYEALSAIMFLKPEVASVGLNEMQAKAARIPYRVGVIENRLVSRNTAMRATRGFVKLLAAKDSSKILGLARRRPAGVEHDPGDRVPHSHGRQARRHRPVRAPASGDPRRRAGMRANAARALGHETGCVWPRGTSSLRRRVMASHRRRPKKQEAPKVPFRQAMRESVGYIRRALSLVWKSSPSLTAAFAVVVLLGSTLGPGIALAGKKLVDAVVAGSRDATLRWVGVELGLVVLQASVSRAGGMVRSILGSRLGTDINVAILERAQKLELRHFEDPEFYDRLVRARREASSRPLSLVSETFSLVQSVLTLAGYAAILVKFNAWVVLVFVVAAVPATVAEMRYSKQGFKMRNWRSPETRKLNGVSRVRARQQRARERGAALRAVEPFPRSLQGAVREVPQRRLEADGASDDRDVLPFARRDALVLRDVRLHGALGGGEEHHARQHDDVRDGAPKRAKLVSVDPERHRRDLRAQPLYVEPVRVPRRGHLARRRRPTPRRSERRGEASKRGQMRRSVVFASSTSASSTRAPRNGCSGTWTSSFRKVRASPSSGTTGRGRRR